LFVSSLLLNFAVNLTFSGNSWYSKIIHFFRQEEARDGGFRQSSNGSRKRSAGSGSGNRKRSAYRHRPESGDFRKDPKRPEETGKDRKKPEETGRNRKRPEETGRDRRRLEETGRDWKRPEETGRDRQASGQKIRENSSSPEEPVGIRAAPW
jgi:hypothetical protein